MQQQMLKLLISLNYSAGIIPENDLVCLKFFIHHNETALLKQNKKYKIDTFSIFGRKALTLYMDIQ